MRRVLGVVLSVAAMGCATVRPTHTVRITPEDAAVAAARRRFDAAAPQVLRLLSESDIRLANRFGHGTGGDPFLLMERQGFVDEANQQLNGRGVEIDISDALAANPRMAPQLEEQRILHHLIDSEGVRIARERDFAGSAIDLLSAVLEYVDAGQAHEPDTLLAWRLQTIRDALKPNTISGFQREELRALLVGMGRRGPKTQTELTGLSKKLETLPVAPYPLLEERTLDLELSAFVGLPDRLDKVEPFLEQADQAIRFQLDVAFGVLDRSASNDVQRRAAALLAKPPSCFAAADVKTAREMAPPDERERSCGLVRALSIAQGDIEELAALLALHQAVMTAGRAASMHGRVRDPQVAARRWSRIVPLSPEDEHRELLLAADHPTKAIAGGAAAGILTFAGGARAKERAREWMRFGDASFDVIEQHLAVQPHRPQFPEYNVPKVPAPR